MPVLKTTSPSILARAPNPLPLDDGPVSEAKTAVFNTRPPEVPGRV